MVESLRKDDFGQLFIGVARISMHGSQHAKCARFTPSSLDVHTATFVTGCALCVVRQPKSRTKQELQQSLLFPLPVCGRFILKPLLLCQDSEHRLLGG